MHLIMKLLEQFGIKLMVNIIKMCLVSPYKISLEENLDENIVTSSNRLNYKYKKELIGE